jgi:hypothetical protein
MQTYIAPLEKYINVGGELTTPASVNAFYRGRQRKMPACVNQFKEQKSFRSQL